MKEVLTIPDKEDPPNLEAFLRLQATEKWRNLIAQNISIKDSEFAIDHQGLLIRSSAMNSAHQILVPNKLPATVFCHGRHAVLAWNPGNRKMYDSILRSYYWPHKRNDVHLVVKEFNSCAKTRGTLIKYQSPMKLFPATDPLEFASMDILGPLPKSKKGNQYVIVITDR